MSPRTPDFAAARQAMIDSQLRPQGVTNPAVLAAMASVPREQFVPEAARALAYADRPIDLGEGRALMPPAALGKLVTELEPRPGERALVVGSGNGYAAKVLDALGLDVDEAEEHHSAGKALYDIILIDGAVEDIPAGLVARLAPHGRLGAAIAENGVTRLAVGQVAGGRIDLGQRDAVDAEDIVQGRDRVADPQAAFAAEGAGVVDHRNGVDPDQHLPGRVEIDRVAGCNRFPLRIVND